MIIGKAEKRVLKYKLKLVNGTYSGLTQSTTKSDVGLGNVENTEISTFGGSSNITTVGTIGTGTWEGTALKIRLLRCSRCDVSPNRNTNI